MNVKVCFALSFIHILWNISGVGVLEGEKVWKKERKIFTGATTAIPPLHHCIMSWYSSSFEVHVRYCTRKAKKGRLQLGLYLDCRPIKCRLQFYVKKIAQRFSLNFRIDEKSLCAKTCSLTISLASTGHNCYPRSEFSSGLYKSSSLTEFMDAEHALELAKSIISAVPTLKTAPIHNHTFSVNVGSNGVGKLQIARGEFTLNTYLLHTLLLLMNNTCTCFQ